MRKTSFYRSFNAVYGRIGRAASEEVILQLIFTKCLPYLLYGVDVCPINKSEQKSFDFSLNRVFMKLFRTSSMDIIQSCKYFFSIPDLMDLVRRRKLNFLSKVMSSGNISCQLFRDIADCVRIYGTDIGINWPLSIMYFLLFLFVLFFNFCVWFFCTICCRLSNKDE